VKSGNPLSAVNGTELHQSDWLGSEPYFYNAAAGLHGPTIQDATAPTNFAFDDLGLSLYLAFGYSVFGTTPVKNVKFVPAHSKLIRDNSGSLSVAAGADPLADLDYGAASPRQVMERFRSIVEIWAKKQDSLIVVPLSGGIDSRLILWAMPRQANVLAVTYGTSPRQWDSSEVTAAREVASRLGFPWRRIELQQFHEHLPTWYRLYGCATHSHGMYHLAFYEALKTHLGGTEATVVSGLLGDVWAGSTPLVRIHRPLDLVKLGFTHGLHAEPSAFRRSVDLAEALMPVYSLHRQSLQSHERQTIFLSRTKIMLLSYLLRVPKSLGFRVWSPFLDLSLVRSMLELPREARIGRRWQFDFLEENHLSSASAHPWKTYPVSLNSLDYLDASKFGLPPLDEGLLSQLFEREYLTWITNRTQSIALRERLAHLNFVPDGIRKGLWKLTPRSRDFEAAYAAYLCLYPLAQAMRPPWPGS